MFKQLNSSPNNFMPHSSGNIIEAEMQTSKWLKIDKGVLFEPAIRFENFFEQVDNLVGNILHFQLI
jgi:hypothetical protein